MTAKLVLDHPGEHVARLTIDNPERRGALDHELLDALGEHTRTLDATWGEGWMQPSFGSDAVRNWSDFERLRGQA